MALNDQELLYVYQGLHHIFREDLHLARPLIQLLQKHHDEDKALQLSMEMARRMLARGHPSSALGFLGICKRLNHPQQHDVESMMSMAKMTLDSPHVSTSQNFSLIEHLSDHEVMDFISQATMLHCDEGFHVVQQGEISDSFYIILEGQMEVHLQLTGGSEVHLRTLLPGYYFGEYACVYQLPRTASVTASDQSIILQFSNEAITKLMECSPEAGKQLMNKIRTRLISSITQVHPAFTELADADRHWLSEESSIIEFQPGDIENYNIEHRCCIVIHGQLTATHAVDGKEHHCTLRKNDIFGNLNKNLALPDGTKLHADERCLVCSIPEAIFQSFMIAYGNFELWLKEHSNHRCQALSK